MEFTVSGNALKAIARSITCLARVGSELVVQVSSSQIVFHTLNSSRSAYQSITFIPEFFDSFIISENQVQFSVLLKAVCSVLRTPISTVDHMHVQLLQHDASKVRWTLNCYSGMRKSYWISCNIEPDVQNLSLDRRKFPSSFVVRPRDLNRLLANFQPSLQEITIIATDPTSVPSDISNEIGGKAVELRSYIDPTKDNDCSLHTQLWIDPLGEFVDYTHSGDPVDVTFSTKELKAFLSFCEGCDVDIHLFFEKAGEPILLAPKFSVDDCSLSNFDGVLVLATMLSSQLQDANSAGKPPAAPVINGKADHGTASLQHEIPGAHVSNHPSANISEHPSGNTRIWSELSGGAKRDSIDKDKLVQDERNPDIMKENKVERDVLAMNGGSLTQHHRSNWVDPNEGEDDDDGEDLYVQATPPYDEEY